MRNNDQVDFGSGDSVQDSSRGYSEEDFIQIPAAKFFMEGDYPFIVGSKGEGKTFILQKKFVQISKTPRPDVLLLSENEKTKLFSPDGIIPVFPVDTPYKLGLIKNGVPDISGWDHLWQVALLRAIMSGWLSRIEQSESLPKDVRQLQTEGVIVQDTFNPFQLLTSSMEDASNARSRDGLKLIATHHNKLRALFNRYLHRFSSTILFLDNPDGLFERDPDYWISSSAGLFFAVNEIHKLAGGKVRCYCSLRPEALRVIQRDQNYMRFQSGIRAIYWDDSDLFNLFKRRLHKLRNDCFYDFGDTRADHMAGFIGPELYDSKADEVKVANFNVRKANQPLKEPISQYLCRHTLWRPREIIIQGNAIVRANQEKDSHPEKRMEIITEAVNKAGSEIALSYLGEVAHRWEFGNGRSSHTLEGFIRHYIPCNILTREDAMRIQNDFACALELPKTKCHPLCRLASFGLLGWPAQRAGSKEYYQHFNAPGQEDQMHLPGSFEVLLVHPILYDAFQMATDSKVIVGRGLPYVSPTKSKRGRVPAPEAAATIGLKSCFISYSETDKVIATQLRDYLISHGVKVWLYEKNSTAGEYPRKEIEEKIAEHDFALVLCSAHVPYRPNHLWEIETIVLHDAKKIIPVSLDNSWKDVKCKFRGPEQKTNLKAFLSKNHITFETGKRITAKKYAAELEKLLKCLSR